MLKKITDFWPELLQDDQGQEPEDDAEVSHAEDAEPVQDEDIELAFKNLRWTRVIALRDFEELAPHIYKMADDILYGQQHMAAIQLEGLPQLCSFFDPIKWQEQNPHPHLCVFKLNVEQLKDWGEVATEIRKSINKKAENYKLFSEPAEEIVVEEKSRRSVQHSTRLSNDEGLLES